jgi:hypothetical protein
MDTRTSSPGTTHELYLTSDSSSFSWCFQDRDVTLSADGLSWSVGGVALECAYSDIADIRLHRATAGKSGSVGICRIGFRDGTVLNVHGSDHHGLPDDGQSGRYATFVHDLHARLAGRQDTRHIRFHAGLTEGRYTVLTIAIIAAGLLFVLLPFVLLLIVRDLHVLGVFAAGAALFWSFYKLWDKNRPRSYSPAHVPEDLLS